MAPDMRPDFTIFPCICLTVYLGRNSLFYKFGNLHLSISTGMWKRCDDLAIWWKHNKIRYPASSKVAQMYLAPPPTSVPSEGKGKGKGKRAFVQRLVVNTEHTSKALGYGTRSQGISQFYLHTPRSSANGMNHTCLLFSQPKLVGLLICRKTERLF